MAMPSALDRHWGRVAPTFIALGIMVVAVLLVFPPMYVVGKRHDDERTFLRNYRAPNEYEAFASYPMNYALESREHNDVIFVGDSSLRCDIRTTVYERETGVKAYNLGNAGLIGISGQTQIVRAYLSHHPKPRLVVVCIQPKALAPEGVEFRPPEEQDVKSRFLWCFGPGTEKVRRHNSYLYLIRQGFKYMYGRLAGGFDRFAHEPVPQRGGETYRSLERAVTKERGYWEAPPRRMDSGPPRITKAARDQFTVSASFKREFSVLLRLFADQDIPVMIRLTPWLDSMTDYSPKLRAWGEELESSNQNVIVARPEILLYEPSLFFDHAHLGVEGAEQFTRLVAAEVKQVLAKTSPRAAKG